MNINECSLPWCFCWSCVRDLDWVGFSSNWFASLNLFQQEQRFCLFSQPFTVKITRKCELVKVCEGVFRPHKIWFHRLI